LRGAELDLLWPFEPIEPLARDLDPDQAAALPHWRLFMRAFLLEQALGPDALLAAQPGRLEIQPYQLVPVMRALRMSRPRLMLADGVGLGKTIQAGLVLAELIARRRAHRALIVSPAGPLLEQWGAEMRERFGLRFDHLDAARLQEIQFENELGANPFDHVGLGLVSIDFAKQERVLQHLERTSYDLVIIDEAHHCMSLGSAADREDSQRRRLAEVLAQRSDALLLLTATPHDGFDDHFASLMELLDPSVVDGQGALRGDGYKRHVVRRLKRHIKDPRTGEDLFKTRRVHPEGVAFDETSHPRFAAFQRAVLTLIAPQLRRAMKQRRYGDVLAFMALLKRSVSTASACAATLEAIGARLDQLIASGAEVQEERKQRLRTLRDYRRRAERFGVLSFEEEQDLAALEAEDIAAELAEGGVEELAALLDDVRRATRRERDRLTRTEEIRAAIGNLRELALEARDEDPKLAAVEKAIAAIRESKPRANVLVYTEYTDSQDAVVERLRDAIRRGRLAGEVLPLSGADDGKTRASITERFRTEDDLILVSTDASAEGLNLHQRCHHLVHLELPYNPNRLEQRNGRIDRYGQKHDPEIRYLYLAGTFEERLLLRLVAKYERQRARLTFVPNTLGVLGVEGSAATVRLLEGVAEEDQKLFRVSGPPVVLDGADEQEADTPAYRELLAEVERAFAGFDKAAKTHSWLGEVGAHAEERVAQEASAAREASARLGVGDLSAFVLEAARADLGTAAAERLDATDWVLRPSGPWAWDLDDLPGYDPGGPVVRLTTDPARERDDAGHLLGYLGRAHPLVRRALDRVRNVQFGAAAGPLDRRVSAARHEGDRPALLVTFLGRVSSSRGRELERVVAVRVEEDGKTAPLPNPADWEPLAAPQRAIPTSRVWESTFQGWGENRIEAARHTAEAAFEQIAAAFAARHSQDLEVEARELERWFEGRVGEVCGSEIGPRQVDLFAEREAQADWRTLARPKERLAAFATDGATPARARAEAQTLLSLFERRRADLDGRGRLGPPTVEQIGLLMLVPDKPGKGR
jgi:ERCC4-related helicase